MIQYAIIFSLHAYATACIVCQVMHGREFYNLRALGMKLGGSSFELYCTSFLRNLKYAKILSHAEFEDYVISYRD